MTHLLKTTILILLLVGLHNPTFATELNQISNGHDSIESSEITRTVLDYVEGWYSGDEDRMDRALSPDLAKRRITSDGQIIEVSKTWMVNATKNGRGKIDNPEQGLKDITILAQTESMASVQLFSEKFIDYLLLKKVEENWKIVNVLWEYTQK